MGVRKGQMFIISAIFIIVMVVLIRNSVGITDVAEEARFQDTRVEGKVLENVQKEIQGIVSVNYMSPGTKDMLFNFTRYLNQDLETEIFFVYVVSNGTTQNYTVATGNLLGFSVNVTFNATNSTPSGTSFILADKSTDEKEFDPSIDGITLNVSYNGNTESFSIKTDTTNHIFMFTDIKINNKDFFMRGKDVYEWSWPY